MKKANMKHTIFRKRQRKWNALGFTLVLVGLLSGLTPLSATPVQLFENFVANGVSDTDSVKNFWQSEGGAGIEITERNHMINFDITGGGGAKYAAIRSKKDAAKFNFFDSRKVMYVKKMRKSGSAAGVFRFEVTGTKEKYSSASDAVWVDVKGKNVSIRVKKNGSVTKNRSIVLEQDCIMIILELDDTKYYLKSYCQVSRPSDPKRKNQLRLQTMSGTHGLTKGQWGSSGDSYVGISAERTASSGKFHYDLGEFRALEHSRITRPDDYYDVFPNGAPPGVSTSDPFYKQGIINVKRPPYNAAGDGIQDDTWPLQNAMMDAYEYGLITYIPSGTYRIKDKIMGMQKAVVRKPSGMDNDGFDKTDTLKILNGKPYQSYTVFGDNVNPPVLKLDDGADGFDSDNATYNSSLHREVFQIWSQPNGIQVQKRDALSEDPIESSTGLLFGIVVRDLTIDVGRNKGAIGFNVAGSQGCNVSDITVIAPPDFGFACFRDLGGAGGSNVGLKGTGCKYGIYLNSKESSYPHVAGLHLEDQTVASIHHRYHAPVVMTGAKIVKDSAPIITLQTGAHSASHFSLVDAEIQFRNNNAGEAFVNSNNKNLHLHNVFIKNATKVTKNKLANATGWTRVREYAFNDKNGNGLVGSTRTTTASEVYSSIQRYASAPSEDFFSKHCPTGNAVPGYREILGTNGNNGTAVSIRDSRIVGDSNNSDWHAEIQEAVDRFPVVYIPKGNYEVSEPIILRGNTKLIGFGHTWSSIGSTSSWSHPLNTAILQAAPNSNPVVSDLKVIANQAKGNVAVLWQGGAESITRTVNVLTGPGAKVTKKVQMWKITGTGGGRHYGSYVRAPGYKPETDFRIIQVLGTTNPLAIYGINSETGKRPHHEIKNANNVSFLSIKNEVGGIMLQIDNSSNILIAGQGGKFAPQRTSDAIVNVLGNCNNISIANIGPLKRTGNGSSLKMGSIKIDYPTLVSLAKKGNTPNILPFGSSGGGNGSPVLASIVDVSVNENQSIVVNLSATDSDGDSITLSASGVPGFGTLVDNGDGTGNITFNPNFSHSGSYVITVTADDGNGGTHNRSFTLTVSNVNRKPNLPGIADKTVIAGNTINLNVSSVDPDGDAVVLSTPGLPSFGSFVDNGDGTGQISLSPTNEDAGTHTISYRTTDSHGARKTKSFVLTVEEGNSAPAIMDILNTYGDENTTITVGISASDPDGDNITITASGIPAFGVLNDNGDGTGEIVFNPNFSQSGTYPIQVSVEDPDGLSVTDSFSLIVSNVNRAPALNPIEDQLMGVEGNLNVAIVSSDPDAGDVLSLSVENLPSFGEFTDNGDGTGSIEFNPALGDASENTIVVTVNDGNSTNATNQVSFTLTVEGVVAYRTDFSSGVPADDFEGDTDRFAIADGSMNSTSPGLWSNLSVKNDKFSSTTVNYKIVSRMKSETVGADWKGAALRFRDIDVNNFYELQLQASPGADIRIHGKIDGVADLVGEWDLDLDPNSYNTFSLEVSATNVTLYVGNTRIGGGAISLSTGKVGMRQRGDSASWDYFRVIGLDEPDYIEDFNDQLAQGWDVDSAEFEFVDTGAGDYALSQVEGQRWDYSTFSQTVSVDANYSLAVDGKASAARTKAFDSPILVLKYVNNRNWVYIYLRQDPASSNASNLVLKKRIDGTIADEHYFPATAQLSSVDITEWYNIRAEVKGSLLSVWINGEAEVVDFSEADLENPIFGSNTKCGVRTAYAGPNQFDNFVFYDEYNE